MIGAALLEDTVFFGRAGFGLGGGGGASTAGSGGGGGGGGGRRQNRRRGRGIGQFRHFSGHDQSEHVGHPRESTCGKKGVKTLDD